MGMLGGNHKRAINCFKKILVGTRPNFIFVFLHLLINSAAVDFGKKPFYCFFNNTFNKCGRHCGEVDEIICAADKYVTFVNGRERNMRLCRCLTWNFGEYFTSAKVKG